MTSEQDVSSLFVSGEDPFSVSGGSKGKSQTSGDDPFTPAPEADGHSNIANEQNLFGNSEHTAGGEVFWTEQGTNYPGNGAAHAYSSPSSPPSAGNQNYSQGSAPGSSQPRYLPQPSQHGNYAPSTPSYFPNQSTYTPNAANDPYRPSGSSAYNPPTTGAPQSSPYVPHPGQSSAYTPQPGASTAYGAYSPAPSSSSAFVPQPPSQYGQPSYTRSSSFQPPPPAPVTTPNVLAFRPATSNAYDPPVLKTKRAVSQPRSIATPSVYEVPPPLPSAGRPPPSPMAPPRAGSVRQDSLPPPPRPGASERSYSPQIPQGSGYQNGNYAHPPPSHLPYTSGPPSMSARPFSPPKASYVYDAPTSAPRHAQPAPHPPRSSSPLKDGGEQRYSPTGPPPHGTSPFKAGPPSRSSSPAKFAPPTNRYSPTADRAPPQAGSPGSHAHQGPPVGNGAHVQATYPAGHSPTTGPSSMSPPPRSGSPSKTAPSFMRVPLPGHHAIPHDIRRASSPLASKPLVPEPEPMEELRPVSPTEEHDKTTNGIPSVQAGPGYGQSPYEAHIPNEGERPSSHGLDVVDELVERDVEGYQSPPPTESVGESGLQEQPNIPDAFNQPGDTLSSTGDQFKVDDEGPDPEAGDFDTSPTYPSPPPAHISKSSMNDDVSLISRYQPTEPVVSPKQGLENQTTGTPPQRYGPPPARASTTSPTQVRQDRYAPLSVTSVAPPSRLPYEPAGRSSLDSVSPIRSPYDPPVRSSLDNAVRPLPPMGLPSSNSYSEFSYPAFPNAPVLTAPVQQATRKHTLDQPPLQTYGQYAPSPSLLGTNDPLGRAAARIPVFTFGFGGKIVSCFHNVSEMAAGYDVAMSGRRATDVSVRILKDLIPSSALESSTSAFPGPLMADPDTQVTSLGRATGASATKGKKATLIKYLDDLHKSLEGGVGFTSTELGSREKAESRLALIRLLKVLLEHDGRLSGSPEIEQAVRVALVPHLSEASTNDTAASSSFIVPAASADQAMSAYGSSLAVAGDDVVSSSYTRKSSLDTIQNLLMIGERRKAYQYALDEKLWAHALLIANAVDKEAWMEAVHEFVQSELGVKSSAQTSLSPANTVGNTMSSNGRESLRVVYGLFSGRGATSVEELVPQKSLAIANGMQPTIPETGVTPMTPNFPKQSTVKLPPEILTSWSEIAATIISNTMTGDSSALTSLGDSLMAQGWYEAAHACYLLSPSTSPIGGASVNPSIRMVLVGSQLKGVSGLVRDQEAIMFTEILEYVHSLSPITKGQEVYPGMPHLQPYRLIRALHLLELGNVDEAQRYNDAITATINLSQRRPAYYNSVFLTHLKELSDRLAAAPHVEKGGSWIARKMKPSFNVGNWFERIMEGSDEPQAIDEQESIGFADKKASSNAFANYSTISNNPSASPSPTPSLSNVPPPAVHRATSAMGNRPALAAYPAVGERAASAMDHLRPSARQPQSSHKPMSANASTTSFTPSPYGAYSSYAPATAVDTKEQPAENETSNESGPQYSSWYDSIGGDQTGATPTAASFHRFEETTSQDNGDNTGFMSLMDSQPSFTPMGSQSHTPSRQLDDDDDLGLGNLRSNPKPKVFSQQAARAEEPEKAKVQKPSVPAAPPSKPEIKPAETLAASAKSGGWLSRLWGGGSSTEVAPGPVKAKMGQQLSMYFDPEKKKWINPNVKEEDKPAAPPPPPSRVASRAPTPGSASPKPPSVPSSPQTLAPPGSPRHQPLPPSRPPSAAVGAPPSGPPVRARSNLAPSTDPPEVPSSRPGSAAPRRNLRNRYVDVMKQS